MTTNAEKRHLHRVSRMGCVLCKALGQPSPEGVHVHHLREGQGMGQRASHFLTIPLCPECHQGKQGIHGDRTLLRIAKVEELDLLAMTIEAL